MAAPTSSLVNVIGCRVCRQFTEGRCQFCHCVAYCSIECMAKDLEQHVKTCKPSLPGLTLRANNNPLTDYQTKHPQGWARVESLLNPSGIKEIGNRALVVSNDDDVVRLMSWEEIKQYVVTGNHIDDQHAIYQGLKT